MKQMYILCIGIIVVVIAAISIFFYQKDKFDITIDPVANGVYNNVVYGCGECAAPVGYGMNMEHDKDIGICSFIKKFDNGVEFASNVNQDPCDIPARQICEVLYQYHQQYFENMWSGLGECEIYQKEQCKKCPSGLLKVNQN